MPETIGIIGAGRFGMFWGEALSKFYPVRFYDPDDTRRQKMPAEGEWVDLETCMQQSFIFLTIPISEIAEFLRSHAAKIRPGSIILDCASVKIRVADWFSRYVPEDVYYALSHPLFGPDSAKSGLKDHRITLMPGKIPFERYQKLVKIFSGQLHLQVINLNPEEHDRLMAYNLSLIHLLGRTCHGMELQRVSLMMDSLKKLTGISRVVMNDSTQLFRDFFRFNPYSLEVCRNFRDQFSMTLEQLSGETL
jgi:prephenate dehydrogenase